MKSKEIDVGGVYAVKVSGRVVPVIVLCCEERFNGVGMRQAWRCRNRLSGREIVVRSSQRFRYAWPATERRVIGAGEAIADGSAA